MAGARVSFAGGRARTDRRGVATVRTRLALPGRFKAMARAAGRYGLSGFAVAWGSNCWGVRAGAAPTEAEPARRAVALAFRHLLPLLVVMHVIAYADRVNITFAETELTRDLAISSTVFGLAAGIFFASYVVLEIPSNLVLHRVGARRWMGRIMISWGIVAAATAFVWDGTSLIVARILLGVAEAGFFPGVVYLISCWFPSATAPGPWASSCSGSWWRLSSAARSRAACSSSTACSGSRAGSGSSSAAASPRSRSASGCCASCRAPAEAPWLPPTERAALERELAAEAAAREARETFTLRDAFTDSRILRCAAVYFTINFASYGTIFWFADIVERVGDVEGIELGLLAGIPMALGSTGLIVIGRRSDRSGDRRRWVTIGMLLGAVGLIGTAVLPPEVGVLTLALCAFGLLGAIPAFWAMPTSLLSGRSAAGGGIALISTIGVGGGLFGPVVVGAAKDAGSLEAGLAVLAAVLLVGAAMAARLPFGVRQTPATGRGLAGRRDLDPTDVRMSPAMVESCDLLCLSSRPPEGGGHPRPAARAGSHRAGGSRRPRRCPTRRA